MALSVVKRPQGYVLSTTDNTATVSDSSGDALFTKTTHGLVTADIIYIYSAISSHNGFWYVEVITANTFKIREYATADFVAFIVTGSVTYYASLYTHAWHSIHLPIVYKMKSTSWPTNAVDTARTITTFSNYNGYTYIVASGDIKATGTASSLEQVILSGTSVDGVYKILQWFSDTNFVINLAYSGANVLSSGTVQYYYYNYHVRVKVYAGIRSAHSFTSQKQHELVTEQRYYPNSSGVITFNIADFIKEKVKIVSNNSLLETLPNNIDAWCNFYIEYAESYDDSNGYTVSEFVDTYTEYNPSSSYAVNAKLPFKNRHSGAMSEYIADASAVVKQKFLTSFTRPTLFANKYFDLSFIRENVNAGDYIRREVYVNGVLKEVFKDTLPSYDEGVYRHSIEQSGWGEDTIYVSLCNSSDLALSEVLTIDVFDECTNQDFYLVWLNYLGGYDYWNFTARKTYSIDQIESKTQEKNIYNQWPNSYGEFADSIVKNTLKRSGNSIQVNSQYLTSAQLDAVKLIVTSPLVQICTSQYDRRTLLLSGGLPVKKDEDNTFTVSFNVKYTDELPSQSL